MDNIDRIVKINEFMQILGCKKSEFYARFKKMANFPEDTGVYMKMQSWWLSDVIKFIEELKDRKIA